MKNPRFNSHYSYFLDGLFPSGMNDYRDSKTMAELESEKLAQKNRMNLTILEPSWVLGNGIAWGLLFVPGQR